MTEIWRPIPGYEGRYRVSSDGRIMNAHTGRILKAVVNSRGYQIVGLRKDRKNTTFTVHRLVMLAFDAERPDGMVINHLNGIKTDNRLGNLEYCTQHRNIRHSMELHGESPITGTRNPSAKLNPEKVREIRRLHQSGIPIKNLAKMFGIQYSTMRYVVIRKTWQHVA